MRILAIFGPTGVGKTGVAIALAEVLRGAGRGPGGGQLRRDPGLPRPGDAERRGERRASRPRLEHRLLSFVDPGEEFSAGRYAEARPRGDRRAARGRGAGRSWWAAPASICGRRWRSWICVRRSRRRSARRVEREIAERGPRALHGELDPELARNVDPNDRKRIARLTELARAGIDAARGRRGLWTAELRHPTLLVGLTMDRERAGERIDARVEAMVAAAPPRRRARPRRRGLAHRPQGARLRALARLDAAPSAETIEAMKRSRNYARRQLTWMRKMAELT